MELVEAPQFAPAVCCLTSQGGPLVDTGRQVAQTGRAYLHPDIILPAAEALGMVSSVQLDMMEARLAEAIASVNKLEDELAELRDGEEGIYGKYDRLRASLAELLQHGVTADAKGTLRFRKAAGNRFLKDPA